MLREAGYGASSYWITKSHDRKRQVYHVVHEIANIRKEGRHWKDTKFFAFSQSSED